jgi:hypothetical protein
MEINQAELWSKIIQALDELPNWQDRITRLGQVSAVEDREKGYTFSEHEVFQGIVKAVLSNSTDWSKIERVLPELNALFRDFDLHYYASLDGQQINSHFIPWFIQRRAGSMTMRRDLTNLIETARKLLFFGEQTGSLHQFFASLLNRVAGRPINLVCAIGTPNSPYKLPALGIPIAAEAMKNIGYDVAKPDRHINRATGSLRLVWFSSWPDCSGYKPPTATQPELITVMNVIANFARTVGERISFLDNAIWLLCAQSGLHLTNDSLRELGSA